MTSARARRFASLSILFAVLVGFYAATHSHRGITDTDLNSLQTRSLVLHGDVDLARYSDNPARGSQLGELDGHVYSIYGVGISLVAAPIYAVLVRTDASESMLQGAIGSIFAAAAAVVLGLVLLELVPVAIAVSATLAFALGTTMWPVASMGLFQQGPVVFLVSVGLVGLFSSKGYGPAIAGAGFASAAFVRPTVAISCAVVGAYFFTRGRRSAVSFAAGAFLPLFALVFSNRWIWGTWLEGGYAHHGVGFNADAPTSFVGLTIGWWRGVFVYSPFLALGVVGFVLALGNVREDFERRLTALGVASLATLLFYSKWDDWGGGINQFGYRLQLEIVPYLVVLGAFAVARVPRLRMPGAFLALVSILTMTWGAVDSPDRWDAVLFASEFGDTPIGRAWANLLDDPLSGLSLLGGVAVIAIIMFVLGTMLRPNNAPVAPTPPGVA